MTGNLTTSAKFYDRERTERVVATWHAGGREREIAAREVISRTAVRNIIEAARRNGDPRAVRRNKPDEIDSSAFYSMKQLQEFDYHFKRRLLAAIAAKQESAEIGVYRCKKASA